MGALDTAIGIGLLVAGALIFLPKFLDQRTPEQKAADAAQAKTDAAKGKEEGAIVTTIRVLAGDAAVDAQQNFLDDIFGKHESPALEKTSREIITSQMQGPLPNFRFQTPIQVDDEGRISSDKPPLFSLSDAEKDVIRKTRPVITPATTELVRSQSKSEQIKKNIIIPQFSGTLAYISENRKGLSNKNGDIKYG